ncbi:D-alanine--D-alanine ligase family protein [Rhodovulum marinum]|uniref:D-alanine-D-alanine ligase n=1 Tax=Rhodovulum marinum TaxID=320662 RepID=A0A4R2Q404_9RHOB|nr:D-alanine--D-alanine ligase [Rhodovulum marinum]TCP43317.1 D-alanine-D-alanine ligase [Rhodovulum marinum]
MSGLSIAVLHGASGDRPDEIDTLRTAETVAAALTRLGHAPTLVHLAPDMAALDRLAAAPPDLVFNLVEAVGGVAAPAAAIPARLARRGLAFTGCGARASRLCAEKPAMKRVLVRAGLPTPAWSMTRRGLPAGAPVIVKSTSEHASVGIDAGSVVAAEEAGAEIVRRQARFGGRFFAEAYVEGREFNLSLVEGPAGPELLPPAEILFEGFGAARPRIVDYEAKWIEGSHGFENTPRRFDFAPAEDALLDRLRALALAAWRAFDLDGYARVDFRVGEDGQPWILEVNTNPCLAPDAGLAAAAARAGLGHDALVGRIVAAARATPRKAA